MQRDLDPTVFCDTNNKNNSIKIVVIYIVVKNEIFGNLIKYINNKKKQQQHKLSLLRLLVLHDCGKSLPTSINFCYNQKYKRQIQGTGVRENRTITVE